ncbi:MAG: T9SS type A sorting domain-containing protein [candidate division KSB1 bacterium]|nr:T9SS type A sorting domain-containing protein [candidate division KSB1 bacterium]
MGIRRTVWALVALMSFAGLRAWGQSVGDYRTRATGDWSNPQIWQRYNGTTWVATANPPSGSETITVQSADSVYVNVPVVITGRLINQGRIEGAGNLSVGNGGIYQHDRDGGTIPTIIWQDGSTLLMTGTVSQAPANRNQSYYNMVFDTPNQSANFNMGLDNVTIRGNIRVINTGYGRWYLTTAAAMDTAIVTVLGDVIVEGGAFSVQGTGNAQTTFIVHHYGNIVVTGGNFSISRGSQPGGTTTWYLYEGDFSMSNATTQSSTQTPGGARFVFAKQGVQHLTLGEGNTISSLPIEVKGGTALDMGMSRLAGSGIFILNEGATLMTGLPGGVEEIFQSCTGAITLADGSSYGFNGTSHQITSSKMPTVVRDLIINNPAGVTLSQQTTILGVLRLMAGEFDNTIPFVLGPEGRISFEGGTLKIPVGVERQTAEVPTSFSVAQNYPNPFNASTCIRLDLPSACRVRIRVVNVRGEEVATLFDGRKPAGTHTVIFEAGDLPSGVYVYRVEAEGQVRVGKMILQK